jgi:hypothetical protein
MENACRRYGNLPPCGVHEILGHARITITKDVSRHLVEGTGGPSLRP